MGIFRKLADTWISYRVETLISRISDESDPVKRIVANQALVKIGEPAVPALIEALKDKHRQWSAAYVLGEIGDTSAVPHLIEALDSNAERQGTIVRALGRFRDTSVVPALFGMLKSKDREMKKESIWQLKKFGEASVRYLIKMLEDKDDDNRLRAAEALCAIKDLSAVPALIETLTDEHPDVRHHASWALSALPKGETMEAWVSFEKSLKEGFAILRKKCPDKGKLTYASIDLARQMKVISMEKNIRAPKRDMLLPDKPKPPKRGGIYQVAKKVRNG